MGVQRSQVEYLTKEAPVIDFRHKENDVKAFLLGFQLISAAALIATVLLHSAKGEGLGGIGGQAKLFGTQRGLEQGLDRLTVGAAVSFISISIALAIVGA